MSPTFVGRDFDRVDFNLTPVLARAHYEQMARYFADYGRVVVRPGELCYLAVDASEPAGKPIAACRKAQVALELAAAVDQRVLRDKGFGGDASATSGPAGPAGPPGACAGGVVDGGGLGVFDVLVDGDGEAGSGRVPSRWGGGATRGQIRDIGPGVSHKSLLPDSVVLRLEAMKHSDPNRKVRDEARQTLSACAH